MIAKALTLIEFRMFQVVNMLGRTAAWLLASELAPPQEKTTLARL